MTSNGSDSPPSFLGGLGVQEFLNQYWQKKPLFIANGFPEWKEFISPDEIAGLSLEEQVESRIILEHSQDQWELRHGPFEDDTFANLPESRWTLLVQALDHYLPELASLLDRFNFLPQWRIDDLMVSYATTGGSVGPHYDYYDVFLIQIAGSRHWQTGQSCNDDTPLIENLPVRILENFEATGEWVVQPGDVLYLPPGMAHHGVALDDDCITLSVGFRAPSYADIISEYSITIADSLEGNLRYQDKDLVACEDQGMHAGKLRNEAIDRIRAEIQTLINDRDRLSTFLAGYLSLPKYEATELQSCELSAEEVESLFNADTVFQRDENSRFLWLDNGEGALFVNGHRLPFPESTAALAEFITTKRQFAGSELKALIASPDCNEWLVKLIQLGLLYPYES